MTRIAGVLRAVWDFVVGDDWRIAAGVALAVLVTALLGGAGVSAWWLLPPVVAVMLALSVLTAIRARERTSAGR